jgi:hypothetical protein
MKSKLLLGCMLMLAITLFAACSTQETDKNAAVDAQTVKAFTDYMAVDKGPAETKKYLDSILPETGTKTADALVGEYVDYLELLIVTGLGGFEDDPGIADAGIKFVESEGTSEPVIDYHFIDGYSDYISGEMKEYAAFMALDSDNRWAADAELRITLKELGDRIALAESFLSKYPGSARADEILSKYRIYLAAFLGGIDNTPLVDYDKRKIKDSFIDAYEYFKIKYPELKTTETVEGFADELKAEGYSAPYGYSEYEKQSAFRKHVDELVQAAVDKL